MPGQLDLMLEADKRGLLPPEKKAMLDEAIKRGLVNISEPATPKLADPEQGQGRAELLSSVPMRIAKGLKDTIDGPAQLLSHLVPAGAMGGLDAATQALYDTPVIGKYIKASNLLAMPSGIDKNIRQSNAEYEQARQAMTAPTLTSVITGQKPEPGFDAARFVGNVLGPGNKLIPGGGAGSTARQLAMSGAKQGAVAAAIQPVTSEGDYWTQKGTQVGAGTLAGAALGPVIGKTIQVVAEKMGPVLDRLKLTLSDPGASREADRVINEAFQRQGVDAATIPDAIKQKIKTEVQDALKTGNITDPTQIARKAEFSALNIEPTAAQLSREPMAFAQEKNLRGIVGAGEPLTARFNAQNNQLIGALNTRGALGSPGAYQVSEATLNALKSGDTARQTLVGDLYKKATDNLGRAAPLDVRAATENAGRVLAEEHATGSLPGAARDILNDLAMGKIPFTVDTKESIVKALYRMGQSPNKDANYAVNLVRKELDNAPLSETHNLGEDALAAFRAARTAHAARMELQKQIPALDAAVNGMEPDKFFQQFILNGNRNDLMKLSQVLRTESPSAVAQIKSQILDHLKTKALNGASDEVGVFSQSAYNKALDALADKLPAFFTKQEIADLGRIGRVASYIQAQPAASAVNNSNTTSAAMNLLSKIGKVPGLGAYVNTYATKPLQSAAEQKAVEEALAAKLATQPPEQSAAKIRDLLNKGGRPLLIGAGIAAGSAAQ